MTEWTGTWHPLAERFPMLDEDELREMAASIKANGQFVSCVMGPDGVGRDGRNRVAACALAGVNPRWEVHDGDPIPFIVEVNAERRHLTTGQRAIAVAIGLVDAGKRRNRKFVRGSVPEIDDARHAWTRAVWKAGVVLDHAPELADAVLAGDLALETAHKQADETKKGLARIEALGGELAALVDTGVIDVAEAERRADEATRIEKLEDDLAEKVNAGNLALDEAEIIAVEREKRLAIWVLKVRDSIELLEPMANGPLPSVFRERLPDNDYGVLTTMLAAVKRRKQRQHGQQAA